MSLKKNLDVKVFEQLREMVIRSEWTPGQALSPDELAAFFGVSKTPVLHALKRMEEQKMINVTSTGHFYVPEYSEKDICDLLEMRALLERQTILKLSTHRESLDFYALSLLVTERSAANKHGNVVAARKADMEFHRLLAVSVNNPYLTDLYDRILSQFIVANYLLTDPTQAQQTIASDEHVTILEAIRAEDYTAACAAMDMHIFGARDKILKKMRLREAD